MKEKAITHEYRPRGAASALFTAKNPEVLLEGPAGTGKTRAALEYVNYLCEEYPGIRVLLYRKTRTSMSESVLVTWEEKVLWDGHPARTGEAQRNTRQHYKYPNGSHVVIGGMDNSDRIMSTEYDIAVCFEATEISLEDWEKVLSRLRNNVLPWQQALADCNPSSQYHWLNQRANQGLMHRLLSRHVDNPSLTAEYLANLERLTGARYERLFKGRWVSEEGLVYDDWDPSIHVVDEEEVPAEMKWHFGSIDWGYRAPGVFQIWGVDGEQNLYRLVEIYRTAEKYDWWADQIADLHDEYELATIVCDPAEPRSIDMLNDRLGNPGSREVERLARKGDNDIMAGLDMMRWALRPGENSPPKMRFVKNALVCGRDAALSERHAPCCTEEEFPGFVWLKQADGQSIKEKPDPACPDHGLDAARYAAMFAWRKDLAYSEPEALYEAGSAGDIFDHEDVLKESY